MEKVTKNIRVYLDGAGTPAKVWATQGDCGTRFIRATMLYGGDTLAVDATASACIQARRKDGESKTFAAVINEDGTVTAPLTGWMLEKQGNLVCNISVAEIKDGEQQRLTSMGFVVVVGPAASASEDIQEDEHYDILLELVDTVHVAAAAAEQAASDAKAVASSLENAIQTVDAATERANAATEKAAAATEAAEALLNPSVVLRPNTWADVQSIVRAGRADRVFAIGDQLICEKDGETMVWDVIGIDHDTPADSQYTHSMTLQLHDCLQTLQYDSEEAFYYCETGLAAGTYNVTFGTSLGKNVVSGKSYQFTLTNAVPAGGQLAGFYRAPDTAPATWTVSSYKNSKETTAIETVTVSEGTDGTSLCSAWTAVINGNVNSLYRAAYGSNSWAESAARQYLNSGAAAGSVWAPQTIWDRPPSWATTQAGFMDGLDADFLAVIGETEKVTTQDTVCEDGNAQTTQDKFFFLSRPEVFCGAERSQVDEGSPYPYYADYSDYTSPNTGADKNRIKYLNGSAQRWWLRTPRDGFCSYIRYVSTTGSLDNYIAYYSYGVAPACNII